ncbi:MAG: hypothetical protein CMG18_07060 [Candidatus Marinimicrobia bacterium]|jgi:hypothetical protein|nr:hypothetical protein [Candidatus Neomarinimicrobiota bacterium]|tara:strand:- start:115 stop:480 length:366 start_codon:yes stop_codon:yes gene_type:complete
MNLQMIFRVNGVILFINGLNFLLNTKMFLGMAGFDMTPQLLTLAQAMGVSLISIGLLSWRTPDIAGEAMSSYGQLYAIIGVLWVLLIGYHFATGQASGPPVYGNLAINAVLATLFFMYSKK